MKIAYLSHGHSVYDLRFLAKMVERGHRPYLLSYWPSKVNIDIPGVKHIHYHLGFPRVKILPAILHLKRMLDEIKPDILHTGFLQHHGFYGALTDFHPTLSMPYGSDVLLEIDRSWRGRMMAKFTLQRADMITCDCELVKKKIVELAGCSAEKVVVFPWGIDLDTFRPAKTTSKVRETLGWGDKKILVMTRQFRPIYGIECFIDALPLVMREMPEIRVILVGAGPLENAYRQRIGKLGLDNYVHFAGWLDETNMADHLNAADIYVSTSLSDGTSASLLEALACGLPVVVSNAPVNFEWVENGVNGFVVPRKDSIVLAERLVTLLRDEPLRQRMGQRNLGIALERADWEKNFDVLEGIYKHLVEGAR
jgi:glycosyltransferase involved in cell wall biosynthesis